MFTPRRTNMQGVIVLLFVSCLLIQTTYAEWELLIKSDGSGETFGGKKAFTVSAERFRDFPHSGVLGVWSKKPEDADDDQKATLTEEFHVTCGSRLRLWAMVDDEFVAKINGVKVLDGDDWDEIKKKEISINDSKYDIIRCGATGKNVLTIEAQNDKRDASIAYTLQEETDCQTCPAGQVFNNNLCRCAQISARLVDWNFLEQPINIFDHALDFKGRAHTSLNTTNFPAGANPKEILIAASANYERNNGPARNMIKFYQDPNVDDNQSTHLLEYVMMLYKRGSNAISGSNYHFDVQESFPLMLANKRNLDVMLEDAVSSDSKLNLDIIGWR